MSWGDKRLEDEFSRVCMKLDKIDALLRGNGGPGVLVRVEKLELRERLQSKVVYLFSSIVVSMAVLLIWKLFLRV